MNSRERVRAALDHREPDRVPFDLGGSDATGIHAIAYQNLRRYLGLPRVTPRITDMIQQLAVIDDDVRAKLGGDVQWVFPPGSFFTADNVVQDQGDYWAYDDEWGVGWHMPKQGGLYYDMYRHPLAAAETPADLKNYRWPNTGDPSRYTGLGGVARSARAAGQTVLLNSVCAGLVDSLWFLRGFEQFYVDMAANHAMVEHLADKILALKMAYWERTLADVGQLVDVALEYDDLGAQDRLMFSPATYRKLIKPRHRELFAFIKKQAPVKVMIHACGAIRPLIPDLIEVGVDILNPVQVSAAGMDTAELKREFGKDLVFWGGGVDTQRVLGNGTPQQVRDEVKRRIEDLAPGGGFVFATVHNIQPNVPPENILAMWEALQEYGVYHR